MLHDGRKVLKVWLLFTGLSFAMAAGRGPAWAAAGSTPNSAADGIQEAVRAEMQQLVTTTLQEFFAQHGREQPKDVSVETQAEFDLTSQQPVIRVLTLDVAMSSDQPAAVIREARARLMRDLRQRGYRFEPARTLDEQKQPQARLSLDVRTAAAPDQRSGLLEYLIFAALIGGCLAFFALAFYLLIRPFQRRGRAGAGGGQLGAAARSGGGERRAAASATLPPLPPPPPPAILTGSLELPPLDAHVEHGGREDPKLV